MTGVDLPGVQEARDADRAFFRAYPTAKSYTRPMFDGEYALAHPPGARVRCVAVAFVRPGFYLKALVLQQGSVPDVLRELEDMAAKFRSGRVRAVRA